MATAVGVFFGAFVAAIVSTGALAAVLSLTSPMRWFCRPWLLVTLYGALALLVSIRFHQWSIRKWKVTPPALTNCPVDPIHRERSEQLRCPLRYEFDLFTSAVRIKPRTLRRE